MCLIKLCLFSFHFNISTQRWSGVDHISPAFHKTSFIEHVYPYCIVINQYGGKYQCGGEFNVISNLFLVGTI